MKRRLQKLIAGVLVTVIALLDLMPVYNNNGELTAETSPWTVEAEAAEAEGTVGSGDFKFTIGATDVQTGGQLEYGSDFQAGQKIMLTLSNNAVVASGTAFEWVCDQTNVIEISKVSDGGRSVELNILSPGYAGLYCYVKDTGGSIYANPYCVVHVPLEWEDDKYSVYAKDNPQRHGLLYALKTDQGDKFTIQLYDENSTNNSGSSHYLRKINRITYRHKDGVTPVESNIEKDQLDDMITALEWYSSDNSVVEVDPKTGYMTAKGAGFAKVFVKTTTSNLSTGAYDEISVDVVVVPEANVVGYSPANEYNKEVDAKVNPADGQIVVQTNAKFANTLEWKLYRDKSRTKDITKTYKDNMEISEVTGRVVLKNLPAGVYYLSAIAVKDENPSYTMETASIERLGVMIIVPIRFPQSPIIMNYYDANMSDYYDILENSNLPADMFTFGSTEPNVVSVGAADGVIEAKGKGNAEVRITPRSGKIDELFGEYAKGPNGLADIGFDSSNLNIEKDTTVVLDVEVIDGISISSTSETMSLGAELQLRLVSPNPYDGEILWSSNEEKIVTVDKNGLVKAVGVGDAIVTMKIKVNGVTKRARCKIKVVSSVNSIKLSAKNDFVYVGDNLTISATVSPKVNDVALSWSCSDEKIASVADTSALSMTITGVKPGTVIVTAVNTDNAVVGSIAIRVIQEISKLALSDTDVTLPLTTGYYQLYATCTPELPQGQTLKWATSDKKIIDVDQNGRVTLVKPGKAVISVVTENGLLATCNFTVTQGVSNIVLDKKELELYVGKSERLTYTIKPENASKAALKWTSSNTKIASVDATGYVTGKNIGECVITAQATDGSGIFVMCNVTVLQSATAIKLDVTAVVLNVGEAYTLETVLTPAGCTDVVSYETSDKKVATVNKSGKIQGKAKGTAVIVAKTSAGLTAFCNVTVLQQVTGIKISESKATIRVGDEYELTATLQPKNVTDAEVTWTTDDKSVATVNNRGEVVGVSGGTTIIKCTSADGGYMDYCVLTVEELVSEIRFVPDYVEVGVGKKLTLNVVIENGASASNTDLTFETDNKKICKVSQKGVITGVKLGATQITVTAEDEGGASAVCEVRVINATEEIEVEPTYIRLVQGKTQKIKATVYPENATYDPLWSSDNEDVALVNKKGVVTGVKPGNTVITAFAKDDGAVKGVTYVEVIAPVNATSVTFADAEVIMVPGETKTVPYSIVPSNVTEGYTWSSDNPSVATVDEYSGRITAKAVGASTVTLMTQSGKKGSIRVYVVGLSRENVELHQYERLKIKLEVDGSGSENLTVRWDTDNQTIAEVAGGTITGKALGTTKVYAIVNGRRLSCNVRVIRNR